MSIKLVIFDFDGTIADTRKAIVAAKQKTMRHMGLDVADEKTCASTIGFSAKTGFEMIYPQLEERKIDECVTIYRQEFEQIRKLMPPEIFPDVAMGNNAGTHTCGVTYGNASRQQLEDAGAEYIIDGMRELTEVIDRV